ncbi:fructose-bisphosphate aldolase [Deltaproteobacteria bacterium]|nr:fructose-bisphosphate aldolase [Deltaproteobacteria bacterium]
MKLLASELLSNEEFVLQRRRLEADVVAAKNVRRLAVGPNMTLLFENRATCLWQVQEMCRVEWITAPAAVQHELDTYSALLPGPRELSATLMIEYDEPNERSTMLRRLRGLHDAFFLEFPGLPDAPARFDGEQFNEERVSSVQFTRFALTSAQIGALRDLGLPAALVVRHPAYTVNVPLPRTLRAALVDDLLSA